MQTLRGRPVSPGYARGVAVVHELSATCEPPQYAISQSEIATEQRRLEDALQRCWRELEQLRHLALYELGRAQAAIFDAHLSILRDPLFFEKVMNRIRRELVNVEYAVHREIVELAALLSAVDDHYIRERAQDIRDLGHRVLSKLLRDEGPFSQLPPDSIIIATELLPSETYNLDRKKVAAIVTEFGGENSHASILARALGVPAVTGVIDVLKRVAPGSRLLVDAQQGHVIVDPIAADVIAFDRRKHKFDTCVSRATASESQACVTQDGVRIGLHANIGRPEEAQQVWVHHLDGVGLFRTEFVFLESSERPSFERHRAIYAQVVETLDKLPVVIRTLDLGGDKLPTFVASRHRASAARGLRFALDEGELLHTQLRAVADVNRQSNVSVLFPMVLGGYDLQEAIDLLDKILAPAGHAQRPRLGAMIETPSALFTLKEIIDRVDFLSIGTNDLTQFMLAVDRNMALSSQEYSVLHPAVLRAVASVVEHAAAKNLPVSVCGEAAGDPGTACLLMGLGVRELSMSPVRATYVRYLLRQQKCRDFRELAAQAMRCESTSQVRKLLTDQIACHA